MNVRGKKPPSFLFIFTDLFLETSYTGAGELSGIFFFKLVLAQALKKEGRSEPPWVRLSRMDTKSVAVSGRHGADTETGLCGLYTQERPAFLGTCE